MREYHLLDEHVVAAVEIEDVMAEVEVREMEAEWNLEEEKDLQEEEETKIASEVKANPKGFFEYANRNIKVRSSVGPLKEGKYFYSGEKKMAEILSRQ